MACPRAAARICRLNISVINAYDPTPYSQYRQDSIKARIMMPRWGKKTELRSQKIDYCFPANPCNMQVAYV